MTPRFILPAGYTPRQMQFVLSRESGLTGWRFYGHADGYSVLASNPSGVPLCRGVVFPTRQDAARMAKALGLPAYAVWNGRKRCYEGEGAVFLATPRDAV